MALDVTHIKEERIRQALYELSLGTGFDLATQSSIPASTGHYAVTYNYRSAGEVDFWSTTNKGSGADQGFDWYQKLTNSTGALLANLYGDNTFAELDLIDNSTANNKLFSGISPTEGFFGTATTTTLNLYANNAVVMALASGGNVTVPTGSITATLGNVVVSAGFVDVSLANALTAAGTDRATSLVLTKAINNITTAAASTGVTLPSAATVGIGGSVIIFNAGANAIKVYGAGSDTIDGVAAATGVTLTNAKRCVYIPVAAATWISAQLGVISA